MRGKQVCPDGPQSRNLYDWQREIEYSIATWGKGLSQAGEYMHDSRGKIVHDARNELIQELSLAILEAGKKSGKKVQGDPYCREGKLNPHVVEVCKRKIGNLKKKAFKVIEWPEDPEEREELRAQIGRESDEDEGDCPEQEKVYAKKVPLDPYDISDDDDIPDDPSRTQSVISQTEASVDAGLVKHLMKDLPADEQQVMALYYSNGTSFQKVAEKMGKDKKQVQILHKRAIETLRTWMRVNPNKSEPN
jgi:RNA polymerase sigma factor (sigma-70 family)